MIDLRYGEPQYPGDPFTYVETWQLGLALDWERSISNGWANVYFSAGAGWRSERAVAADTLGGAKSDSADSAVATLSSGLRFRSARLGKRWILRTTIGLSGTVGSGAEDRILNGATFELQKPSVGVFLGMTFDRS